MSKLQNEVLKMYEDVTLKLAKKSFTVSTMESCTAGLVASLIANTPGASSVISRAFVTYSNDEKVRQGVDRDIIDTYGVYSPETAESMAYASTLGVTDIGVGVTGVIDRADPSNPSPGAGVVYYSVCSMLGVITHEINVPSNIEGRWERKLFVAKEIGETLLHIMEIEEKFSTYC